MVVRRKRALRKWVKDERKERGRKEESKQRRGYDLEGKKKRVKVQRHYAGSAPWISGI